MSGDLPGMLLGIALGVGLAAATGFRVFLPLLIAALAARAGLVPLSDGFAWLASTPALVTLGTAAVLETLAYYVPGVDHVLDLLASPVTIVAGMVASASVMADVPPGVMWPLAIIAGGGIAGLTKGSAALVRAKTGVATGGMSNPVVSTAETIGATGLAILAIALPFVCLAVVIALCVWAVRRVGRLVLVRSRKAQAADRAD
jgi:hypothetical protein